jgi:hypothetical protein
MMDTAFSNFSPVDTRFNVSLEAWRIGNRVIERSPESQRDRRDLGKTPVSHDGKGAVVMKSCEITVPGGEVLVFRSRRSRAITAIPAILHQSPISPNGFRAASKMVAAPTCNIYSSSNTRQ